MALSFLNRCVWRATAGGTGPYTVASAITGYYTPEQCTNPAVVDGDVYRAFAASDDRTEHQEGYGTYDTGTDTFTFTTILSSTNSGNAVNFSAAPKVHMGGPLAQEMGPALIASGSFGGDTSVALDLPTHYRLFRLILSDVVLDVEDYLGFALSSDGGSNYHNAATDYIRAYVYISGSATTGDGDFAIPVGLLMSDNAGSPQTIYIESIIDPGDTGRKAFVRSRAEYLDDGTRAFDTSISFLDGATGRMNKILIFPSGNQDVPPTSGREFSSGVYRLFGMT